MSSGRKQEGEAKQPIPVILDTDIGSDIDDAWALAMLLRSPELDLRLATSATRDTAVRAKIIAKLLELAGRTDVQVGIGVQQVPQKMRHESWARDYDLASYGGKVHADGVAAMIDVIMGSPTPVTLISIGPLPNVAEALRREPRIAGKANFVGMHGSVFYGYEHSAERAKEWNVVGDVKASRQVFAAPWRSITITPLDTCGIVRLRGDKYSRVRASARPLARAVIENYDIWLAGRPDEGASSVLYDTVAVYLSFARDLLEMRTMKIAVTDDGYTIPDDKGAQMDVAIEWKDMAAFEDLLAARLA